jgi:hypothetical protein
VYRGEQEQARLDPAQVQPPKKGITPESPDLAFRVPINALTMRRNSALDEISRLGALRIRNRMRELLESFIIKINPFNNLP